MPRPDPETAQRRANAFLSTGAEYHRLRPGYPDDVVDWMLPGSPRQMLDLGAGTGRLTDFLVARGLDVVAVDPSESMLAVLWGRHPGVVCRVGTAEATGLPDASVDAVVFAQAWHWMDAAAASAEAARVLRPGGTLAMVWNQRWNPDGWQAAFHAEQYPADGMGMHSGEGDDRPLVPFGPGEVRRSAWSREVSAEDYLAGYTTHSPFLVADRAEQDRRLAVWRSLIAAHAGPTVTESYTVDAWRYRLPN